jgi:hypothetical protein
MLKAFRSNVHDARILKHFWATAHGTHVVVDAMTMRDATSVVRKKRA